MQGRKTLVATVSVIGTALFGRVLLTAILALLLTLHLIIRPFKMVRDNVIEVLTLVTLLMTSTVLSSQVQSAMLL